MDLMTCSVFFSCLVLFDCSCTKEIGEEYFNGTFLRFFYVQIISAPNS